MKKKRSPPPAISDAARHGRAAACLTLCPWLPTTCQRHLYRCPCTRGIIIHPPLAIQTGCSLPAVALPNCHQQSIARPHNATAQLTAISHDACHAGRAPQSHPPIHTHTHRIAITTRLPAGQAHRTPIDGYREHLHASVPGWPRVPTPNLPRPRPAPSHPHAASTGRSLRPSLRQACSRGCSSLGRGDHVLEALVHRPEQALSRRRSPSP